MKRRTWVYLATGVLAAAALLAWAFAPRPVEVEVAQATRGRFEATIDEDAKTRLRDRYVISAPLGGQLERISLREGDLVKAGDALATLAPVLPPMLDERTRRELQARVEVAEAQVLRTNARIERAKVSLQQAGNELSRSKQLAQQGFVSPTKVDNDRLAVLAAQKEIDAAVSERNVARHEVEQARAALIAVRGIERGESRRLVLRAPIDGRVLRVTQPSEAAVALGTPLLELGDTRRLEIVAELLTTDALKTPPGSRVVVERWGGEGLLEGRVRLVEPAGFTKISALGVEEQRVRVLIDITSPPGRWEALGDGFRVGVRIVTLSLDDVMRVPVSAVFPVPESEDGGMAVFKVVDGRARLVPIQLGARNGAEAWVQGGLQPGDVVVVYPSAAVTDGVRVAVRRV